MDAWEGGRLATPRSRLDCYRTITENSWAFLFAGVMTPRAKVFDDQAGHRIASGIHHKNPVEADRIRTAKNCNWAGELDESHQRIAKDQRWGCACQGINGPAARYEKSRTRPNRNSVLHDATPAASQPHNLTRLRVAPLRKSKSRGQYRTSRALTICAHSARILKAVRNGSLVVSPNSGPVAQLGARFHGMEEVVGSIPTRSTKFLTIRTALPPVITTAFRSPRKCCTNLHSCCTFSRPHQQGLQAPGNRRRETPSVDFPVYT